MSNIPDDFDWRKYLTLSPDLPKDLNEEEAKTHYINHGFYENRLYKIDIPHDFDLKIYRFVNKDVPNDWDDEKVKMHYKNYGFYENRRYKIDLPYDFNWQNYLHINEDLPKDLNEEETTNHYKMYGFFENRKYINENINLNIVDYTNNEPISSLKYDELNTNRKFQKINDYNILNNKYILVIDFPNLGGGTEFFLNTIVSKYKNNQTFLIARMINDSIQVSINDDYLFGNFDENFLINYINNNKKNLKKVFINHVFNHSSKFINFIMNLNTEITTITHDYFLINETPSPYYHEIKYNNSKINFKKLHKLIVQNEENINIFKKILNENENQHVIISPLPDFKNSLKMYNTNNKNIVIGIIGGISEQKGASILQNIINHIKENNLNIKVIVFGGSIIEYEHQYIYNNIDEFNNLLKIHKPNILFETSIWAETYSYTLTLAMLTKLPILSFKKLFKSVIENRLQNYDKKYFYENITEFFTLVGKVKQNYFYTIEPIIYFNSFWDEYFS